MNLVLGIDCGGTHTDAALLEVDEDKCKAKLLASTKTVTLHDDLPQSINDTIHQLKKSGISNADFGRIKRVTLGTTLAVNAIVQNKADKVGLALASGPGLDPRHFIIGDEICIVPGGLDHRGVEVSRLYVDELRKQAAAWAKRGVSAIACVGKFSPRNPEQEIAMGKAAAKASGLPVTLGHTLSGMLNFPRRIATAWYNAAVSRIHKDFLDSVEQAFRKNGITAQCRLLKADGGAIPFSISRKEPVQSILSGPAASVMGILALWQSASSGCSILFDMGGTTTDMALFYDGSPVIDRDGMLIRGRRTLVKSLASVSIGVGGDSLLSARKGENNSLLIETGPLREGPAMAFGGARPTLLDALNTLDGEDSSIDRGDVQASINGLQQFCADNGLEPANCREIAQKAIDSALDKINRGAYELVEGINSRPVYTISALKSISQARPQKACLVGGPALCLRDRLQKSLGMPVDISPNPQVANAIGAALTIPTASLEIYADTGKKELFAPACDFNEKIPVNYTLEQAKNRACELLELRLEAEGITGSKVEVVEADLFATLDDYGRGAKDMRVTAQVRPGIVAKFF